MTYTRTHNAVRFADPYKTCNVCGGRITGYLGNPGPSILTPCEHDQGYTDACPSWSPVDGCRCEREFGHVDHPAPAAVQSPATEGAHTA